MFSKNAYTLPQVSSSLHSRASTSVVDVDGAEFLLHHHDMLGGHYLAATAPFLESAALFNQDAGGLNNGGPYSTANACPRKPMQKRDRHSKIYTSQGPRDRRVRLSIGIARKFFDLQEMLGFDKPSKTLEWLLTKSKTAIKDLVQNEQNASNGGKSASSLSECVVESAGNGEAFEGGSSNLGADLKGKSVVQNGNNRHRGAKNPEQVAASNLAKESRVKARARARERTREKMSIKQLNETRNTISDLNPSIPIHYINNQLHEACKISGCSGNNYSSSLKMDTAAIHEPMLYCPPTNGPASEDLIQESIVIKRKVKHPSILGFQQNLFISRDLSPNCDVPSAHNTSENWDISSFASSQPNLCAILDQPKFLYSSSNN